MVQLHFDSLRLAVNFFTYANEDDTTEGAEHAEDFYKGDELLEPEAGHDRRQEWACVERHEENRKWQVLDRERQGDEANCARQAPHKQNHAP